MNDEGLADVAAANPFRLPRRHPELVRSRSAIPVRGSQLDRKVAEGPCLTREERALSFFLLRENGGRAAAVFHPARNQAHLAGTTTAPSAAEDNLRPRSQDGG